MRWIWTILTLMAVGGILAIPSRVKADDFVVYSVYKNVDLGNPDEPPQKDFYINMGSNQGVHEGSTIEVLRKIATYDLLTEKLYRDIAFPIAHLKVIHVETTAAIARLDSMLPADKTPAASPRAVMAGDLVRLK